MQKTGVEKYGWNALVAEGENRLRHRLVETLRAMGLNTYEAEYGREAVDIVSSVEIHALVLDAQLPDFGGLEAVRMIRAFREVPPFLLFASEITRALQNEAMEYEAVSILRSPVDLMLLSEMLEVALGRRYVDFRRRG